MSASPTKKKIVVLGGGAAAMATAFGLTQNPSWRDEYEITVYQLGWRLGGKGASGRNQRDHQRIEEHGLHIWGGYYWNSFRMMKSCYEEYDKIADPGVSLRSIDEAFGPLTQFTWMEAVGGQWSKWHVAFPFTDERPWDHDCEPPTLWQSLEQTLSWMLGKLRSSALLEMAAFEGAIGSVATWIHEAAGTIERDAASLLSWVTSRISPGSTPTPAQHTSETLLNEALSHVRRQSSPPSQGEDAHTHLSGCLGLVKAWLDKVADSVMHDTALRRLYISLDLSASIILGLLRDDVFAKGLNQINDVEYREWVASNGATKITLDSPAFGSIYDYAFAFENGDTTKPSLAAGTVVEVLNRSCFHYRGAISWRMSAGMGDTIFSPIYRVLKERGVHFKFFHRVHSINLSDDGKSIGSIELGRQVTLKDAEADYQPLLTVKGVECWPSEPLYDQIDEAEVRELRRLEVDLESAWSSWNDTHETKVELRKGVDFDLVVLGISIAALADICKPLIAASPAWSAMVRNVKTVQTQAVQLWLSQTSAQLGWDYQQPLAIGYAECLDTYADMSHLLSREDWGTESPPASVAYFCGALKDAEVIPAFSDHEFPAKELGRVDRSSIEWLEEHTAALLSPASDPPPNSTGYVWTLIDDPAAPPTPDRFRSQYSRANINPTERYVLSVPGSYRSRMRVDGSGFDNLYLAGDWVTTQLNAGCVEAAVTAGLLASRAICGFPTEIIDAY